MDKEEVKNKISNTIDSKTFNRSIHIVGAIVVGLAIFCAGIFVGEHGSKFDQDWGKSYSDNFGRGPGGISGKIRQSGNAFGVSGVVLSVTPPSFIVQDSDSREKVVTTSDDTAFHLAGNDADISVLTTGQNVVVIGEPNSMGQINARFVRIFPMSQNIINNNQLQTPVLNP